MKTSEFREAIDKLGFTLRDNFNDEYYVNNEYYVEDKHTVASVSKKLKYSIATDWTAYEKIEEQTRERLFKAISEYTSTPIAEREPEKRYRLPSANKHAKGLSLVLEEETKEVTVSYAEFAKICRCREIFTESELETMDLTGFERVEVKE